jgi:hypothetical protein
MEQMEYNIEDSDANSTRNAVAVIPYHKADMREKSIQVGHV